MTEQRAVIGHLGHGGGGPEADRGLGPGAQVVPVALPPARGVPAVQLSTNHRPRFLNHGEEKSLLLVERQRHYAKWPPKHGK